MRRVTAFSCEGETLLGSLDEAPGATGLLIVSGGNEPRFGAHRGMALLAARVAAAGWPVFRFDRRGVGDSPGENGGWSASAPDIAAAVETFRREAPHVARLVGCGNCDAATALALFGGAVDALVLANPWVVERDGDLPPPAAIRARYADKLRNPREWWRLLRGGVDLRKLFKGLRAVAAPTREQPLALLFAAALQGRDTTVVLARGDATAIAYADAVKGLGVEAPVVWVETDSHSFARAGDMAVMEGVLVDALAKAGRHANKSRDVGQVG
ncbi:hydrolase 1, exosortase A system-associated [Sphingomonas sp.]|uniref:hydrolase 1, exosortase A system-associated n=1 Tax=Sphingomonas sp. TaxID=28214 RepID=UPI003CC57457